MEKRKLTWRDQRMAASVLSVIWLTIAACFAGRIAGDWRVGVLVAAGCLWFGAELGELGCTIAAGRTPYASDRRTQP